MANTIIMARRNFLENYVKEFHCANSKTAEMASGDEAASGETSEAVTTEENDATEIDIEEVEWLHFKDYWISKWVLALLHSYF